jgi:acetylornithine deacetylase/succinyl-diaminopimelate desuccinylase-like protein
MLAGELDPISADALELVTELCRLPSISAEKTGLEQTAGVVERLLADAGFQTQLLRVPDAAPAVYGEQHGRSPYTLLLYNHYDVQPPEPLDAWTSPPFEPEIREGCLFARGASDNKGELATRLATIRALRAEYGELPIGIRWIIEGEEEMGSANFSHIAAAYADLLKADGMFWEGGETDVDGRPELGIGVKGVLAFRLDVRTMAVDGHSGAAGVLPGAPWRLLAAIGAIQDPHLPGFTNAVAVPSAEALDALHAYGGTIERDLGKAFGIERFVDEVTGDAFLDRLAFQPSFNIAGISTGYSGPGMKTVTPATASAWFDFRLVPDQDPHTLEQSVRRRLADAGLGDVEMTVLATSAPIATPIDHPLVCRVASIAGQVAGKQALIMPIVPGSLPLLEGIRDHVGVPGLSPPDNPTYPGSRAHAPDEHIRLGDIPEAIRYTRAFLESLGAAED